MRWFWRSNPFVKNSRRNFLMERADQGGLESPSLEVSEQQLDIGLTRWWWVKCWTWWCLEGFSKTIPRFGIHKVILGRALAVAPVTSQAQRWAQHPRNEFWLKLLRAFRARHQNELWLKLLRGFRVWRTSRVTSTPLECALLPHPLHPWMQRALTPIRGRVIPFGRDWTQIWGLHPNCVSDTGGATFLRVTEGKQTQRSAPVSFGTRTMPKGFFAMKFETKGDFWVLGLCHSKQGWKWSAIMSWNENNGEA